MKGSSFKHFNNTHNELRFQKLRFRCGMEGYGLYWIMRERTHQKGGYLDHDDIKWLAREVDCPQEHLEIVLNEMLAIGILQKTDDGRMYFAERS